MGRDGPVTAGVRLAAADHATPGSGWTRRSRPGCLVGASIRTRRRGWPAAPAPPARGISCRDERAHHRHLAVARLPGSPPAGLRRHPVLDRGEEGHRQADTTVIGIDIAKLPDHDVVQGRLQLFLDSEPDARRCSTPSSRSAA